MNFFTVSGVAATRASPGAVSRTTAIFMPRGGLAYDQDDGEGDDEADDRPPLEQPDESFVVAYVVGDLLRRRIVQQRLFVRHFLPLGCNALRRSITRAFATPNP
jgi:hypothetical protein